MGRGKKLSLRAIRADIKPKLNQTHASLRAGMGLKRYWQIENGEGPAPTRDEQKAVAAALGVRVSDVEWPELARDRVVQVTGSAAEA